MATKQVYAIFDTYEVFMLCGRNLPIVWQAGVLMPTGVPEKISKNDILIKYGTLLE